MEVIAERIGPSAKRGQSSLGRGGGRPAGHVEPPHPPTSQGTGLVSCSYLPTPTKDLVRGVEQEPRNGKARKMGNARGFRTRKRVFSSPLIPAKWRRRGAACSQAESRINSSPVHYFLSQTSSQGNHLKVSYLVEFPSERYMACSINPGTPGVVYGKPVGKRLSGWLSLVGRGDRYPSKSTDDLVCQSFSLQPFGTSPSLTRHNFWKVKSTLDKGASVLEKQFPPQ
ncbi:Hypothetical predicted protein [Podarcis lilfordi]|uniref:Uncharacterized protein n=1 Tax=Podarcis lilfordi TaxID=74358 RepID=A0AA35LEF5_9SAUR|nr:Hypothetical predicted protein [Podarcis lilfordi]